MEHGNNGCVCSTFTIFHTYSNTFSLSNEQRSISPFVLMVVELEVVGSLSVSCQRLFLIEHTLWKTSSFEFAHIRRSKKKKKEHMNTWTKIMCSDVLFTSCNHSDSKTGTSVCCFHCTDGMVLWIKHRRSL